MKTIKLNEEFKIEVDELNKTLKRKHIKTKGDLDKGSEIWKIVGYYSSWDQIFNVILDLNILDRIMTENLIDLKEIFLQSRNEIIDIIDKVRAEI